ncbi:PH domain-containing protein [Oceanobacillus rekensis]|uniref:PH domain-containing protein n=1 Tax=Oceanobacillus rekensis TaxID=937927 RepID=UPI000B441D21|nr:PH domain-containing protein [Oceanobacillus rekensis]
MVFRSKVDAFFVNFMLIVVLIIGLISFFPLFIEDAPFLAVLILTSTFLIVTGFILWTNFSVKYIFYEDYLFIKGGPFRSRIPYENITKVSPTTAIFSGHSILSSRDAIEIFNKTTFLGSIKISPREKREFISELKKHCPNVHIQE